VHTALVLSKATNDIQYRDTLKQLHREQSTALVHEAIMGG
jgi:hypothetical protein